MWQHVGMRRLTCWNSPSSTTRRLTKSWETSKWSFINLNWLIRSGLLWNNSQSHSRQVYYLWLSIDPQNTNLIFSDLQRCNTLFFMCNTKPRDGDSSHGPPQLFSCYCCSQWQVSPIDSSLRDNWKEIAQQVLWFNRPFRGLLHFYGYVFIYCYLIILTVYQVLHPCHKLEYFKRAGWDDEWITTAHEIVQTEYDHSYAFMEVDESDNLQPELVCASQAVAFVLVTDQGISSQKPCLTISSTTFLSSHVPNHPLP